MAANPVYVPKQPTDTPRTNAAAQWIPEGIDQCHGEHVWADFARGLERELAALKKEFDKPNDRE